MTGYLEETCEALREYSAELETFEVPESMLEKIIFATSRCRIYKEPEPELMIGEAFRSAAKLHSSLKDEFLEIF